MQLAKEGKVAVSFANIEKGGMYSRPQLAEFWGYTGYQAIARGVVTPRGSNKIILFVTEEKQGSLEQYRDRLKGNTLEWEGPTDHFAEGRMLVASDSGDEIHVFYRERHHSDFVYLGQVEILRYTRRTDKPSAFCFQIPQ